MHKTPIIRYAKLKALILKRRREKEILIIKKELISDNLTYYADIISEP
jgi:hypothetical protein